MNEIAAVNRLVNEAMRYHRDGNLEQAVAFYEEALAQKPDLPNVFFLLALALSQGPDPSKGEAHLLRYIDLAPNDAAAFHALGKICQSRTEDPSATDWFRKAIAINDRDSPSWNDLGTSLHRMGRFAEAVDAFTQAISCDSSWAMPRYNLGTVHFDMGEFARAEKEYLACLELDQNLFDAYSMLAMTLDQLHRPVEAEAYADAYAHRVPVATKPCLNPHPRAHILILMAAGMCNIRTDYLIGNARYQTTTAYIRPADPSNQAALLNQLPSFDIVFSAMADPDRILPFMEAANAVCQNIPRAVINPPDGRIIRTRRDRLPELLKNIPGVIIPETRRLTTDGIKQIFVEGETIEPPLLVRPCGFHGGKFLERFDCRADLAAYFREVPHAEYYVSPYYDYRSPDGYFRKYRFIFVDRKVYPYHLAISSDWLVHYFRADMPSHPWMCAEEEAFLADYRQIFSGALGEAVSAVAEAVDLDFAGLDCSITPGGKLLVFEANAAMLVHLSDSPVTYPYKHRYVPRIADAMDEMIRQRLARP